MPRPPSSSPRPNRWRAPRKLRVTPSGRALLALTFGIGLGALNTGNNLLFLVLGFLLAVVVVSGVLSERVLRDLSVRRLLPDGAFATEPFPLRYRITRQHGHGFALRITEGPGTLEASAWVAAVSATEPAVVRVDAVAPRRGPLHLTGLSVATTFPFGLFEKSRFLELEDLLVVWPRRGFTCEVPPAGSGLHRGDLGQSRHRDGGGDLLGLRELGDDEDARRVHWRKSASAGRLLKVEREREDRRQYTLTVDPQPPGDALDRACEEAAAMSQSLLHAGHEVGLMAFGRRIRPAAGPGHQRRLLTALAWLGFDEARTP